MMSMAANQQKKKNCACGTNLDKHCREKHLESEKMDLLMCYRGTVIDHRKAREGGLSVFWDGWKRGQQIPTRIEGLAE
jgi:hypothetical protein